MTKFAFITFRPQPNEQQLTQFFLTLFIPKYKVWSDQYCISQEDYDQPSHHIHILISHNEKDEQKFNQKYLLFKDAIKFYESLKDKQTKIVYTGKTKFVGSTSGGSSYGLDSKWNIEKRENNDPKYYIGYCNKEPDTVHDIKGFSQEYIASSIKYYSCLEGIKMLKPSEKMWRILNTRNAHSYITDFCKKQNISFTDPIFDAYNLQKIMAQNGISIVELSSQKYEHIIDDLLEFHSKDKEKPQQSQQDLLKRIEVLETQLEAGRQLWHKHHNESTSIAQAQWSAQTAEP